MGIVSSIQPAKGRPCTTRSNAKTLHQLSQAEQYQISALLQIQQTQTIIAQILGVHKTMIGREVQQNQGRRGYRPHQVQLACQPGPY